MKENLAPVEGDEREALVSLIWGDADAIESLNVEDAADRVLAWVKARRPSTPTEEDVERAAEALSIAAEGKPLCDLRMSDRDEFMREARAVVAALSAVHPEVTQ